MRTNNRNKLTNQDVMFIIAFIIFLIAYTLLLLNLDNPEDYRWIWY